MEEEPAMAVPDTEQEQNFMIEQEESKTEVINSQDSARKPSSSKGAREDISEFDLSDLSVKPKEKSREDIIAEAEAAAFADA